MMPHRRSTVAVAALVLAFLPTSGSTQQLVPLEQAKNPPVRTLITVADDFIVDVYHNGVKLPDDRRELLEDIHGASVERITVDVRVGDWLVFNVVSNRLRWDGAAYFGVWGRGYQGKVITTELGSDEWSCCDDPSQVAAFIADRLHWADHRVLPISKPWSGGDEAMTRHADGWTGKPVWGGSRNTWIKYVWR